MAGGGGGGGDERGERAREKRKEGTRSGVCGRRRRPSRARARARRVHPPSQQRRRATGHSSAPFLAAALEGGFATTREIGRRSSRPSEYRRARGRAKGGGKGGKQARVPPRRRRRRGDERTAPPKKVAPPFGRARARAPSRPTLPAGSRGRLAIAESHPGGAPGARIGRRIAYLGLHRGGWPSQTEEVVLSFFVFEGGGRARRRSLALRDLGRKLLVALVVFEMSLDAMCGWRMSRRGAEGYGETASHMAPAAKGHRPAKRPGGGGEKGRAADAAAAARRLSGPWPCHPDAGAGPAGCRGAVE